VFTVLILITQSSEPIKVLFEPLAQNLLIVATVWRGSWLVHLHCNFGWFKSKVIFQNVSGRYPGGRGKKIAPDRYSDYNRVIGAVLA